MRAAPTTTDDADADCLLRLNSGFNPNADEAAPTKTPVGPAAPDDVLNANLIDIFLV